MFASASKWPRWLRFSLRTLFFAFTALCIWFGVLAAKAHRQHAAIHAILAAGGSVAYDYQLAAPPHIDGQPSAPRWLRALLGEDFFRSPLIVRLGPLCTDDIIEKHVSGLSTLQVLSLEDCHDLTDRTLKAIARIRELRGLRVSSANFTVAGLKELSPLRSLKLIRLFLDKADVGPWARMRQPAAVDCTDVPLVELLRFLGDQYHVPIVLRADTPAAAMSLVSENIAGKTLQEIIDALLKSANLNCAIRIKDRQIVLLSEEAARNEWPGYETLRSMFPDATVEADF